MDVNKADDHSRTIIHIDMDCFYAQVETIKNPQLANVPLGIQQKNIVVTGNYVAREFGIKKCMLVTEAQKLCPKLVLVNGEDLHDYRQLSYKVTAHLVQKYTALVERLGLDENFIDVTDLVASAKSTSERSEIIGNVYGSNECDKCACGCEERLKVGTKIAQDVRDSIKQEFGLTCCAGVAHNKLLAKLVSGKYKPNQQTVVFPNAALELILGLKSFRDIPGVGNATAELLKSLNINTIVELQNCDKQKLKNTVGAVKAKFLSDICYGVDTTLVKPSGKPQSIGLEDSCKSLSLESEIREKLMALLQRLMILVQEDGRAPKTIKLTVRKFDKTSKTSHRETKQCNVSPSLFAFKSSNTLPAAAQNKLLITLMNLFHKMVDTTKPYHITLVGLSCAKFQDAIRSATSLTSFLRKNSLEVQSVTNIENNKEERLPTATTMDCDGLSRSNSCSSDVDSESEPSPKKIKFASLFSKERFKRGAAPDGLSPSKLSVAALRLNSERQDTDTNQNSIVCPPDADKEVFRELPLDVQRELWEDYKRNRDRSRESSCSSQSKKAKPNTLYNYFVKH